MAKEKILDPADVKIGAEIRRRRELQRLTQDALAKACNVTFQQIQKYERGVNRVSAARLLQIAKCLHCHPSELLAPQLDDESNPLIQLGRIHDGRDLAVCYLALPPADREALMIVARALASKAETTPSPAPAQLRRVA
ncbi:MAG: transcriptional regulator [Brevundimonas sp.]|uniref:helix-turn-helix domain-containing protein n=1 Tax=Brevundimonas sp. TaxID=1871086 RepID=UPI000DB0552B|nr:helix-turn-helix domain-containing protein [Brevundimonas sp.]PZU74105.1 MAG: transcriptional regulator [Brevundimonas sp.]